MEDERGRRDPRQDGPGIRGEIELEEGGGDVGVGGMALVATERLDLVAGCTRDEEPGEHLRRQHPVDAREVDEGAAGRLRDVVARGVAAEEHDPVDPLGRAAREASRRQARAGAREQRRRALRAGVEHGLELLRLRLGRRGRCEGPLGQPRAEPVVADDAMRPRELFEEAARGEIVPLLLEMRHPPAAEEEHRAVAEGGVGDPTAVELAEPDVLFHHPR